MGRHLAAVGGNASHRAGGAGKGSAPELPSLPAQVRDSGSPSGLGPRLEVPIVVQKQRGRLCESRPPQVLPPTSPAVQGGLSPTSSQDPPRGTHGEPAGFPERSPAPYQNRLPYIFPHLSLLSHL
jgi:hypothetical protein